MNPVTLNLAPVASDQTGDGSVAAPAKSAAPTDADAFRALLSQRIFAAGLAPKAPIPSRPAVAGTTTATSNPDGSVSESVTEPGLVPSEGVAAQADAADPLTGPASASSGADARTASEATASVHLSESAETTPTREGAMASAIAAVTAHAGPGAKTSLALQIDTFNIQSRAQATVGKQIEPQQAAPAAEPQTPLDEEIAKIRTAVASRSRIAAPASPSDQSAPLAAEPDTSSERALETKIAKLIESGASQADIVGSLAAQLAISVSGQLELPDAAARARLQSVFGTALSTPDRTVAGGSVSDRARSLAQRFIGLERVANRIAGTQSGQQNRIAGKLLDAQVAKDTPAQTKLNDPTPATTSVAPASIAGARPAIAAAGADVLAAQAAAASGSATFAAAASTSAQGLPVRPAGDGRRVQLGTVPAIATGGDTGLGRILTRASLAADARELPSAPDAVAPASSPPSTNSAAGSSSSAVTSNPTVAPSTLVTRAGGSSVTALTAFMKSFEAALKGGGTPGAVRAGPSAIEAAASSSPAQPATANPTPAFALTAAPFTVDRAEPAAATPTPIDHSAIADQVLRGAFMRNVGESSEIRLRLVPDSLGDVSVKLVVSDGAVTAHVVAETPTVRDALVAAQPQLTKSLADAGLKLTSFTVDIAGGGFAGFSGQPNDQSQNGGRPRRWANSADPADDHDETRLEAVPSFGPPTAPRATPGDFNYLA